MHTDHSKYPLAIQSSSQLQLFIDCNDIHGLKTILRPGISIYRRLIWIFVFLTALTLLLIQLYERVDYYQAKHHITKSDILHVPKLEFPAVTVCNMNKHRVSALTQRDIVFVGPLLGLTDESYYLHHSQHYNQTWVQEMFANTDWKALKESYAGDTFSMEDFVNRTSHKLDDMVVSCKWKGMDCEKDDWTEHYSNKGICYTFNNQRSYSRNISKSGYGNGLTLVLNVEEDEYIESKESSDLGFFVLVHHQDEPPLITEFGFGITTGFHYMMSMRMREIRSLGEPYSSCSSDTLPGHYNTYSIAGCRIECEQRVIHELCGCRLVESPDTSIEVCDPVQYSCALHVLADVERTDECKCPSPCHTTLYPIFSSSLKLRHETVAKVLAQNPKLDNTLTEQSLAVLDIYYQAMSYDQVEMVPAYSIVALLCDVGGNMGLYIGASFLALFQILDWLVQFLELKFINYKRKKMSERVTNRRRSTISALVLQPPIITLEYNKDNKLTKVCTI